MIIELIWMLLSASLVMYKNNHSLFLAQAVSHILAGWIPSIVRPQGTAGQDFQTAQAISH